MKQSLKILYGDSVHYDPAGSVGTDWPIGTPTNPCSNLADVRALLAALNLRKIIVHGSLTLDATMQRYIFVGYNPIESAPVNINGQDIDNSSFYGLKIMGTIGGTGYKPYFEDCYLTSLSLFKGYAKRCIFENCISLAADPVFWDCRGAWGNAANFDVGSPDTVAIIGWRGLMNVRSMAAGTLVIVANGGDIEVQASCTGGTITIYGDARVTDLSAVGCTVSDYTVQKRAETIDYGDALHYDSGGAGGTAWPIGTLTNPCNSLANIRTMSAALNIKKIIVHGALTLDATMQGYHFMGFNPLDYDITLDINGQDVGDSIFENLHIVGAMGGAAGAYPFFKNCMLGHALTGYRGWATDCALTGMVTLAADVEGDWHNIQNFFAGATLSLGTPYDFSIYRYSGTLNLRDMTGGSLYIYCSGGAYIYIQSTCTGGQIFIYGDAAVRDDSGAGCNVRLFTLRAEQELISANVTVTETDIVVKGLGSGEATSIKSMRLKCADPGANTVTIRLYERVGAALTEVGSFDIDAANFATYHSLMDMFGLPHIVTTDMKITGQASAGGPYAITGYYCLGV